MDFSHIAHCAVFRLPFARFDAPFHIDKVAFVSVFFYEFSELVAHDDGMPFGTAHTLIRSAVSILIISG